MISIVIPTFNEQKRIEDTLTRLQKGFVVPHEIIVSDGKSQDETVRIARQYADQVVEHTGLKRQTIAQGRNVGARGSRGDFIAFMDADCRIDNPNKFFTDALRYFKEDQKLVALSARIRVFPEDETLADKIVWTCMNTGNWLLNLLGVGAAPGEFQMMRKEIFEKVGGFNEQLVATEDYDMFRRLSKLGRVQLKLSLVVYHSGRHGHVFGWPRLLWIWFINTLSYILRGKSYSKEWEAIR